MICKTIVCGLLFSSCKNIPRFYLLLLAKCLGKDILMVYTLNIYMKKALTSISVALSSILVTYAQTTPGQVNGGAILSLLALAQTIVVRLVPFAVGLAIVVFFYYIIVFIVKGNSDPEAKGASVRGMLYSIGALFVMVSIWGLVGFLGSILGVGQGGSAPIPGVPVPQN